MKIQGAGASFPAPLYMKWFKTYSSAHPGVQIDYQSVGSGKGVQQVIEKTVDFGASDAAMTPEEMAKVDVGVQLLPMTAGSIVLAYNLEGVDHLKLTREAYVGIFLGKITKWNDAKIAAANPGASLPDGSVNVVVRADGSGTSYVFTKHLSALSDEFAKQVGTNKQPNWPVGTKANKNDGVAASLIQTPGSIGYIEYGYAKLNPSKLKMAELQNKAGKFVAPTIESGQAALAAITLPEDLIAWMPDPDGEKSYPIVTFTWVIAYKKYPDAPEGADAQGRAGLLPDRRAEGSRSRWGIFPCPPARCRRSRRRWTTSSSLSWQRRSIQHRSVSRRRFPVRRRLWRRRATFPFAP